MFQNMSFKSLVFNITYFFYRFSSLYFIRYWLFYFFFIFASSLMQEFVLICLPSAIVSSFFHFLLTVSYFLGRGCRGGGVGNMVFLKKIIQYFCQTRNELRNKLKFVGLWFQLISCQIGSFKECLRSQNNKLLLAMGQPALILCGMT